MTSQTVHPPSSDRSLGRLANELLRDFTHLFRQEWLLVQTEAQEKLSQVQTGAVSLLAGLLVGVIALLILLQAVVVALSNIVEPWLASLIVGVATAIVAFILMAIGRRNLSASNLTPERSVRSVRETGVTMKEKLT